MHVPDALRQRRAIKHYDPAHRMSDADIKTLLDLTLLAPSAFNIQNARFVLIRDPDLRQQVRAVAWDQAQVTEASLLVLLCADRKSWAKSPERYWRNAPEAVQQALVPMIGQYYEGREDVQRDECMRSCGIAGMALMLAATDMGYDSCPMDGFDFDAVARLVGLPDDHIISFMIAIGKGTKPAWPKPGQLPYDEVVVTDRFPG